MKMSHNEAKYNFDFTLQIICTMNADHEHGFGINNKERLMTAPTGAGLNYEQKKVSVVGTKEIPQQWKITPNLSKTTIRFW